MPRYGGGREQFGDEAALMNQAGVRAADLAKKELAAAEAEDTLAASMERGAGARALRNKAAREGQELEAREAQVAGQETRQVDLSTAAIEANAKARQAAAAAARQQAVATKEAGAAQARAVTGAPPPTAIARRTAADVEAFGGRAYGATPGAARADVPQFQRYGQPLSQREQDMRGDVAARRARVAAIEAEVNALRPVNEADREYLRNLSSEQRTAIGANRQLATANLGRQAEAQSRVNRVLQSEGAALGSVSQAMYRHGALTSEFIQATARGETTLREMGNQALITAGKFGGWIAAATAIFGAARAIGVLGKGAIDANEAVNKLQQVLPHVDIAKAHEQVLDLSRRYNVSIADVGTTLQETAKHVRTQSGAFGLAGTVLEAQKIFPDVGPDAAVKGLTAISRGFKIPLSESKNVLDQLVVLSSRFGVSAQDSLIGAAKAAAVFSQAGGGGTKELLAMVGAMNRLGYSSNEAGTAIRRSAEIIRRPGSKNRKLLEVFGIDADEPYGQIIRQAVGLVQSGRVRGAQVNQLATALSTPQLSSRFAAILNRPDIYQQMIRQMGDPSTHGAADRRLHTALQSVRAQIDQIGHGVERMGAAMAQAGAGAPFVILLKTLNLMLTTVTDLLGLFNKIPEPIRVAVTVLGEMYVAMRALRRFGALDTRFAALGRSPDERNALLGTRALRDARDAATTEAERTGGRSYVASATAQRAGQAEARAAAELESVRAANAAGLASQEEMIAAETRFNAVSAQRARLETRAAAASQEAADAAAAAAASDAEYARYKEMSVAEQAAVSRGPGLSTPYETGVPSYRGVTPTPQEQRAGQMFIPGLGPVAGATAAEGIGAEAAQLTPFQARVNRVTKGMRDWAGGTERTYASSRLAGAAATRAANVADRAAITLTGVGNSMKGLGTKLQGVFAAMGPLEVGLLAFIAGDFLINQIESARNDAIKVGDQLNRATSTQKQMAAQAQTARQTIKNINNTPTWTRILGGILGAPLGPLGAAAGATLGADALHGFLTDPGGGISHAAQTDLRTQRIIRQAQATARARGTYIPLLTYDQLTQNINRDAKARRDGLISQRQFDLNMAKHAEEAQHLWEANQQQTEAANTAVTNALAAQGTGPGYTKSLQSLSLADLQKQQQGALNVLQSTAHPQASVRQLLAQQNEMYTRWKSGQIDWPTLAQFNQQVTQGVEQRLQQDLQLQLGEAHTEGQRQAAYARYAAAGQKDILGQNQKRLNDAKANLQKRQEDDAAAVKRLQDAERRGAAPAAGPLDRLLGPLQEPARVLARGGRASQAELARLRRAAADAKHRLDAAKGDVQAAQKAADDAEYALKQFKMQERDAAYQDRAQGRQIQLGYQQSETRDPMKQANEAIQNARQQVADAARTYHVGSREWKQAMTNLNQAEQQRDDAVLASVQADNALLIARAGNDPLKQAAASVTAAKNTYLADIRTHQDPNKVKQDYAAYITAVNQQHEQQHQNAVEITQLQGEIAQAQVAGDPFAEAAAARSTAAKMMGLARNQKERLQASLLMIQANNQMHDANVQMAQLAGEIDQARAAGHGDVVAEARAAQNAARRMMSLARNQFERMQAMLALIQANNQAADALRQAASAHIDLLESRTTDPVQQAYYELQKAREAMKGQRGAGADAARAAKNRALQAYRDAQLQSKESDIDFEQQMDKISIQDAIDRYRSLLHMRNLTKQQKRDIQLKIHGLQQQAEQEASGFDLDVGSIKLPTIYDVRRAFDPIRGAIKAARDRVKDITDPNQGGRTAELLRLRQAHHRGLSHRDLADAGTMVQAQVNVYVNDRHSVNAVYDALDRVMNTHVRSQLRSRGHRRVR